MWSQARELAVGDGHGMFMIGELKKLLPANQNFEVIIKHVPDQAFELSDELYRWISENLAGELSLWGTTAEVRLIVIAWFCLTTTGRPLIECLSLMPVSLQWLPVQDMVDLLRIQELVRSRRTFVIGQPYRPPTRRVETAITVAPSLTNVRQLSPALGNATPDASRIPTHHENLRLT